MKDTRGIAILILALALVVVLSNNVGKDLVETLVAMPQEVAMSPQTRQALDRSIIYMVVSGYLKAVHDLTPTNTAKPLCATVMKTARINVNATVSQKLKPFKPEVKKALGGTVNRLMDRLDMFIQKQHCVAGSNATVRNMAALSAELKQLNVTFNSGVRM